MRGAGVVELADLPAQAGAQGLNDVKNRLNIHNLGKEKTTKPYRPFDLIFVQEYDNRNQARDFEKYLKVGWNKEALLEILNLD